MRTVLPLKKILLSLLILHLTASAAIGQSWTAVWNEGFNGLPYDWHYPITAGEIYWTDPAAGNALINGAAEAATTAGLTQVPSDAAGGRFLMFTTNAPNDYNDSVFLLRSVSNPLAGSPYRVSFKIVALSEENRPKIKLQRTMGGVKTVLYSEEDDLFPLLDWTTVSYTGSGVTGNANLQFVATAPFILEWINVDTVNEVGNDFGIDDVKIETIVYEISGSVLDDHDGATDGVNGIAVPGVNVTLYNDEDAPMHNIVTNASGGYSFTVVPGNYKVEVAPPPGYYNVSASDGTPDGIISVEIVTANAVDVNFGINRPPVPEDVYQFLESPPSGSVPQGWITQPVSGEDPGVGPLANGSTIVITMLPLPEKGVLYYNGDPVVVNTPIPNFSTALLSLTGTAAGPDLVEFGYTFVDAAGLSGETATFGIEWTAVLPVVMGRFTATANSDLSVLLQWETLSEINASGFEIEHSVDAKNWSTVGFERAKGGSSIQQYSFTHLQPQGGVNYYRLRQVDHDGRYMYTDVRSVRINQVGLKVYPNPASHRIYVRIADPSSIRSVQLFDVAGRLIRTYPAVTNGLDVADLPNGSYLISVVLKTGARETFNIQKR